MLLCTCLVDVNEGVELKRSDPNRTEVSNIKHSTPANPKIAVYLFRFCTAYFFSASWPTASSAGIWLQAQDPAVAPCTSALQG